MADLNRVTLVGRLTRDAELKYIASTGVPVRRFSIAVNRFRKGDDGRTAEEASFFDIVLWGERWDSIGKYLLKGKQVAIDGELRQDRWTQPDGQQRSKVEIVAQNIQLLSREHDPSASGASGGYGGQQRQTYQQQPGGKQQAPQPQAPYGDYSGQDADGEFPDDVPF